MQDGINTGENTNFWPKPSTYSKPAAVLLCRWRSRSCIDGVSQLKWYRQWTSPCLVFILPPVCLLDSHSWDLTAMVPHHLCCLFLYLGLSTSSVCLTSPLRCTPYIPMSSSRDCHFMTCWMNSLSQRAWVSPLFQHSILGGDDPCLCLYCWSIVNTVSLSLIYAESVSCTITTFTFQCEHLRICWQI